MIIVGAGIAGLAAAGRIAASGRTVALVDARNRLGGRVYTQVLPGGHPVELGAEFIDGSSPQLLDLVHGAGLTLSRVPDRHESMRAGVKRPLPDILKLVSRLVRSAGSDAQGMTVAQLIGGLRAPDWGSEEIAVITAYLEGFHAADLRRFGAEALALNQQAEEATAKNQARVFQGSAGLVQTLERRLNGAVSTHTGTVVRLIRWRAGEVAIEASGPEGLLDLTASQLVLAVPLTSLKNTGQIAAQIRLDPEPPGWKAALTELHMGMACRIVLQFDQAWWIERDEPAPAFLHGQDQTFPVWWTRIRPEEPFLTGWVGGPRAARLRGCSPDELERLALTSAASVFGKSSAALGRRLQASYSHDWMTDPFSGGVYSYGGVGAVEAVRTLRQPVSGTLFLAGEAVAAAGRNATVSGALASGYAAAEAALQNLPQAR